MQGFCYAIFVELNLYISHFTKYAHFPKGVHNEKLDLKKAVGIVYIGDSRRSYRLYFKSDSPR